MAAVKLANHLQEIEHLLRRTVIIITWPIKGVMDPKGQIPTTEPEQIFSSQFQQNRRPAEAGRKSMYYE